VGAHGIDPGVQLFPVLDIGEREKMHGLFPHPIVKCSRVSRRPVHDLQCIDRVLDGAFRETQFSFAIHTMRQVK
jgi:hypothetical protein